MTEPTGERLLSEYVTKPFHAHGKRHIAVEHRLLATYYPGVGADIRHEVRCTERDIDEWTTAEAWEFRSHGVEHVRNEAAGRVFA